LQALQDAIEVSTRATFDFSYNPEDIRSLYDFVTKNEAQATAGHMFISKFKLDKLLDMILLLIQINCMTGGGLCLQYTGNQRKPIFWKLIDYLWKN